MKRIRVRPLIEAMIRDHLPGFSAFETKRPGYWFRASRSSGMYFFVVIHSFQTEPAFDVNIAATLFQEWRGEYGDHHVRSAAPLAGLQPGRSSLKNGEWLFTYDGSADGAVDALARIGRALEKEGLSFLEEKERRAVEDPVLQAGLRWIHANAKRLPELLLHELEVALRKVGYATDRVQYPPLDELKSELRRVAAQANAPNWARREIRVLGLHLLELAAEAMPPQQPQDSSLRPAQKRSSVP